MPGAQRWAALGWQPELRVPVGNSCSGTGEFTGKVLELQQHLESIKGMWDVALAK